MQNTACISQSQVLLQYFLAVDLLPEREELFESCPIPAEPLSPSPELPALMPASDFSR